MMVSRLMPVVPVPGVRRKRRRRKRLPGFNEHIAAHVADMPPRQPVPTVEVDHLPPMPLDVLVEQHHVPMPHRCSARVLDGMGEHPRPIPCEVQLPRWILNVQVASKAAAAPRARRATGRPVPYHDSGRGGRDNPGDGEDRSGQ